MSINFEAVIRTLNPGLCDCFHSRIGNRSISRRLKRETDIDDSFRKTLARICMGRGRYYSPQICCSPSPDPKITFPNAILTFDIEILQNDARKCFLATRKAKLGKIKFQASRRNQARNQGPGNPLSKMHFQTFDYAST